MTQPSTPVATSHPVVLIFGIVTGRFRPQAARFRADEVELARYLAAKLNLTMLTIDAQLLDEIGLVVPEWQLRPYDQVVIPFVRGQILEQLRQLAQTGGSDGTASKAGSEGGNTPIPGNGLGTPLVPKPVLDAKQATRLWDGLGVGGLVLAADIDMAGEKSCWWEAIVLAVQDGVYLLRWREPEEGVIRRRRHQLALLHPDADQTVQGEG